MRRIKPVILTLRACRVCGQRVAHFNEFSLHCRHLQGPQMHTVLTQNESRIVAALMYPPGYWRTHEEIYAIMWPNADGGPLWARGTMLKHMHDLRKKTTPHKIKIISGYQRGCIMYLPDMS